MGRPKKPISRRQQFLESESFLKTRTTTSVTGSQTKTEDDFAYSIDSKDNSNAEVPTITRLLNRKKYVPKGPSSSSNPPSPPQKKPAVPPRPVQLDEAPIPFEADPETVNSDLAGEITEVTLERSLIIDRNLADPAEEKTESVARPPAMPQPPPAPKAAPPSAPPIASPVAPRAPSTLIRLAGRTDRSRTEKSLIVWTPEQLRNAHDPLGQALHLLFQKGAESSLFLCLSPPPPGKRVPEFVGTALSGNTARRGLWTWLRWNPEVFPELWNTFVRAGYLELGASSTTTTEHSHRSLLRSAFGVKPEEHLLLLRAGPADACRGVVAILSRKSLLSTIASVLVLISKRIPGPQAPGSKAA